MDILDKIDVSKVDSKGMIRHIENFPLLCEQAFSMADSYSIPSYYIKAKKVVLLGMGGSGEAGDILKNLLFSQTDLVIESVHNYILPGFIDKDTLVIASSYSGDTEETLSGFISAHEKGAKLIAITTGGKLKILAEKYRAPLLKFDYHCPPRASFPFMFIFLLSIFSKLGYINIDRARINNIVTNLKSAINKYQIPNSLLGNPAKILAEKIFGKIPVIYTSDKLAGVGARIKGQLNENSKNFAFHEEIPEVNHKSVEGLLCPKNQIFVLMLESDFEYSRNKLRENVTADVLARNKIPLERIKFLQGQDQLVEIFLHVMFGDFVSYYLAMLNRVNPGTNDTIDYLKERLA